MAKSKAYRQVKRIVLAVHNEKDPTDEEYAAYCEFCLGLPTYVNSYLIKTDGGNLTPKQRAATNETLKKRGTPEPTVAVVTPKVMVRGVVTALSWFNKNIRSFAPTEIDAAMKYLGLTPLEMGEAAVALRKLEADLKR